MSIRMILAALAIALIVVSGPAVRADETSKEKIISEIFDVMQYEKVLDQMFEVTGEQVSAQMKALGNERNVDIEAVFRDTWSEITAELKTGLRPMTSQLWAKYFTEEELAELLVFYQSDVGRKSVEISPQIMQETMAWTQQEMAKLLPGIKERVAARVKAAMEAQEDDSNP